MTSDWLSPTAFHRLLNRSVTVPLALLGVLALVFLVQIVYLISVLHWVDHTDRVISRANGLLKLLVDGETGMRGYLLTGELVFLEPYHVEENQSGPAVEELTELVSDSPAQVERLKALRTEQSDWQDYARSVIEMRRDGGDYQAPVRSGEGKRRMDSMRTKVADFIRVEEELRETRTQTAEWATWVIVAVSLGLTLLLGGVLAYLTRQQLLHVSSHYQMAISRVEAQAESLRKSVLRLESLHEIDIAILAAEPVPALARAALKRMEKVAPGGDAFVVEFDPGGGPAQVISCSDSCSEPSSEQRPPPGVVDPALAGVGSAEFSEPGGLHAITDLGEVAGRSPLQDHLYRSGHRSCLVAPLLADGRPFGVLVLADPRPSAFTGEHQQLAAEVARQLAIAFQQDRLRDDLQRHADELERRVQERTRDLQQALENVKQLQGLLPICAWCKKVRDDKDYWHEVEHYVADHTEVRFTHGICPACMKDDLNKVEQNRQTSGT